MKKQFNKSKEEILLFQKLQNINNYLREIAVIFFVSFVISCSSDDGSVVVEEEEKSEVVQDTSNTSKPPVLPQVPVVNVKKSESIYKTIVSEDIERRFLLNIPTSYKPDVPSAVVIMLHGANGTGEKIERNTRFSDLGNKENFITVFPDALGRDVSNPVPTWAFVRTRSDGTRYSDVDFFRAIIAQLKSNYSIDTTRIYLVGNSNGAFFVNITSIFEPNLFSALGSFAGLYFNGLKDTTRESTPYSDLPVFGSVPMIFLHGLKDTIVPYNGVIDSSSVFYLSADEHAVLMAQRNQAATVPNIIRDDADIKIEEWKASVSNNADVRLVTSKNGTHGWFRENRVGKIDATKEIWDFLKAHPRQSQF